MERLLKNFNVIYNHDLYHTNKLLVIKKEQNCENLHLSDPMKVQLHAGSPILVQKFLPATDKQSKCANNILASEQEYAK